MSLSDNDPEKRKIIDEQMRIRGQRGWLDSPKKELSRAALNSSNQASISGTILNHDGTEADYECVYLFDEYGHTYEGKYGYQYTYDGTFHFTNIPSGKYTVKISYYNSTWYGNVSDAEAAKYVTVNGKEAITLDPITLIKYPDEVSYFDPAVVEGQILHNNTPLINKKFMIECTPVNNIGSQTRTVIFYTDSIGNFSATLDYLIDRDYYCLITGDSISPIWLGGESFESSPAAFTLVDTVSDIVLNTIKSGSVKGKVTAGLDSGSLAYARFYAVNSEGYELGSGTAYDSLDSTFTIPNLPAGEYYIFHGEVNTEDGFYPNSSAFNSAKKVRVESGKTTSISTTISRDYGDNSAAMITSSVKDIDGNSLEEYLITLTNQEGVFYTRYVDTGTDKLFPDADTPFKLKFGTKNIYLKDMFWHKGNDTTLVNGSQVTADITLPPAGRVAGSLNSVNNKSVLYDENMQLGFKPYISNNNELFWGTDSYPFPGKYEIPSASSGEYKLSVIPYYTNRSGKKLLSQPSGPAQPVAEDITITDNITTVHNISTKNVSGMISGLYNYYGSVADLKFYAVSNTGVVKSISAVYENGDHGELPLYHGLFSRNWYVWSVMNGEGYWKKTFAYLDMPLLEKGEYYLYVTYKASGLSEDLLMEQWYGQPSPKKAFRYVNEELSKIAIPANAKKIVLNSDTSWIKNIDFGISTAVKDMASPKMAEIQVSSIGRCLKLQSTLKESELHLTIYSLNGRELMSKEISISNRNTIVDTKLAKGRYILQLKYQKERVIQPIILK